MPPPFHAIRDRVVAAVDGVFAETLRILPMLNGTSDPTRHPFDVDAPLRVGNEKTSTAAGGKSATWETRVAASGAEAWISRTDYPNALVKKGDTVRAMDRGDILFRVAHVNDRNHSRLILTLTEL